MSQLLVIGISVCVLLCAGMIADRLLVNKVAWQDLAWRLTLLAVLVLPLLSCLASTNWPAGLIQVPVLAAQPKPDADSKMETDFHFNDSIQFNDRPSLISLPNPEPELPAPIKDTTEPAAVGSFRDSIATNHPSETRSDVKTEVAKVDSKPLRRILSWPVLTKAIWLLGSICLLARYVVGWLVIRMVALGATKTEPEGWSHAIDRATSLASLNSRIVVRVSSNISTPMLVGMTRPLVLVPESMLQLSPSDARVQAALSHEAMHIRRADAHWNFMLFVCLLFWWPIPMVHWMKKRMFWLRELLCDAEVAVEMGAANYAESLLKLTQLPNQRRIRLLAVPMHSQEQSLESRVAWILELSNSVPNPSRLIRRLVWCCLIIVLVGFTTIKLVPADSSLSPSIPAPFAAEILASEQDQENRSKDAKTKERVVDLIGTVKTAKGKPVGGAIVYLRWNDGQNRLPRKTLKTTTDDEGRYALSTDLPGPYQIWAEGDGLTSLKEFLRGQRIVPTKDETGPFITDITVEKACDYNVTIVSAETQDPIEGAKIHFGWTDIERQYTTDMNGVASIRGLASNDWYFVIKAEGYATFFEKTSPQALGTTTELKYELKPGTSAEINLRDQNDDPVTGAIVEIQFDKLSMTPHIIPYPSRTNEDGKLLVTGLPRDTEMRMVLSKDGYQFGWDKFEVDGKQELEQLNFVGEKFPYGGDVEFEVTDEKGQPIAGATLKNPSGSSRRYRLATTDMGGVARLDNLYRCLDKKYVTIKAQGKIPQRLEIEPGPKGKPKLFKVTLKTGKTLKGVVLTPNGKPAPKNTRIYFNEGEHGEWDGGRVTTNSEGRFVIHGLPDFTTITVYTPQKYEPIEDLKFDLADGKEVEIKMIPAAVLRVRAIDETTGEPIPEFNVRLGSCKARQEGDRPGNGIYAHLVNPGVNIHGTQKEYTLDHQFAGAVYKVTVSAKGYQTKTIERMQTVVRSESKLIDVSLTKN